MTTPNGWSTLGATAPDRLAEARDQLHHAAQWPSRAARRLLEPEADDSHSNLGWDDRVGGLVGHRLETGRGRLDLALRFSDLTLLAWLDGQDLSSLPLDGRTDADAGAWTADVLRSVGADPTGVAGRLPYELPAHPLQGGARYRLTDHRAALAELARWYGNAALVLDDVTVAFADERPGPSPVRCWPHHFDIATLIALEEGEAETARAIGVGFAPGDAAIAEPYFYCNPWPHLPVEGLPDLPAPGRWHTDGFVGAVAVASAVVAQPDQEAGVRTYLDVAVTAGRQRLFT